MQYASIRSLLFSFLILVLILGMGIPVHAYKFVDAWPDLISEPEAWEFGSVKAVTVDSLGNIHVADPDNDGVKVFDPQGNLLRVWGDELQCTNA